ncbi:cell fate regulator YaaT (PSP1 superfamily) [Streptohalobacillus salinus]|uniref:Cell fate regulator YaaT (PSP1 superfamily) n=1 Tax=Streptohalobacillus salinus TaxID=621096 RepID=A0A2V3W8A6_9BACI|nr:stage 0 sporulation family protein [Streptohalobacillus salinus]PXW88485.1 cell fate regulator YaaT (PSP1 superfamily) [Streptohalobacillus salinus]
MVEVIGVRFKKAGKIYYFNPDGFTIKLDDYVIVETARGIEFGKVVIAKKQVDEEDVVLPLKKVMRLATDKDKHTVLENKENAKKAFETCEKKITTHKLEMNLVDVEYTFDRNKVIFYFTADGRVDFRDLVKDLASIFRTRIELRQIGVRDEAKLLGGIGPCGRMLCCSTFLGDFEPVSIKMAKDQNLSLNPAKISGLCGRLMCCLKYENDAYEEAKKQLPDLGQKINTPHGAGRVVGLNILERVIKINLKEEERVIEYTLDELIEAGVLKV